MNGDRGDLEDAARVIEAIVVVVCLALCGLMVIWWLG